MMSKRDERFHFSDHNLDQGWNFYFVRVKLLLERDMTQALGFAIREAAFNYLPTEQPMEHLRRELRPEHFGVLDAFLKEYDLALHEVIDSFRMPSRVDGPKSI